MTDPGDTLLLERLRALGLAADTPVVCHANTRILVSRTAKGVLRVHRGYAGAPDPVLRAIIAWSRPRVRRAARLAAERVLAGFPVHAHVPPGLERRRAHVARPGDARLIQRLYELHAELNARHFGLALGPVRVGLSCQMSRRLGEFRPQGIGGGASIVLSRRHIGRDGWAAAVETFLHEMVHQWQAENGLPLAHDRAFRMKSREVGIEGRAVRTRDVVG